jgi:PAS domain S-box-containing protein
MLNNQATNALSEGTSADWLRSVWDLAPDAMVLSDPNGIVVFANAAYYDLYGYSAEQILNQSFAIIFPESERPAAIELYRQVFADDNIPPRFENVVQRADGALRIVETHISFLTANSQRVAMQSVIRDITAQKQTETDLREARQAAQALAAELEQRVAQRTAELQTANAELEQQVAERAEAQTQLKRSLEQLRALATDLQGAREDERGRLARELHDELGGALTVIKMTLRRLGQQLAEANAAGLELVAEMAAQIDSTVALTRQLATELRPSILDDLGLVAALDWQLQEFEARSGLDCQFDSTLVSVDLKPDQAIAMFRVAQESLTNIARHAHASRVTVSLSEESGRLVLRVQDDGQGFHQADVAAKRSLGLTGMRERAYALSGELIIDSSPGRGTTVIMRVALPQAPSP